MLAPDTTGAHDEPSDDAYGLGDAKCGAQHEGSAEAPEGGGRGGAEARYRLAVLSLGG